MLNKIKNLLSDSMTYGVSSILEKVIGFFLLPLYTRYLSPSDYGITAMLVILSALFIPLANLGMSNSIFRRYNMCKEQNERREVLGTGLLSVLFMSAIILVLGLILTNQITSLLLNDLAYKNLVQLTLFSASIKTIGQIPTVILRADRRVKTAATLNVISVLISILFNIWFVVGKGMGVYGVVLATLISGIIQLVIRLLFTVRQFRFLIQISTFKYMLSYGLPFVPHRLLSLGLAQFGIYMIRDMIGLEQVGLYSIALRITIPITFVVGSVQAAWVPYKFQIHAQEKEPALFFRSIATYYIAAITYLWIGISLWGPEVLRVMTTQGFHSAIGLIPLLGLISVSQGFYFIFGTGIELSDNTRPIPLISLAGLIVVISSAFALIPRLGAAGAALATVAGWLMMAFVVYSLSQTRFKINYDWMSINSIFVISVCFVILAVFIQHLNIAFRIFIGITLSLFYPVLIFAILYRSPIERNRMKIILAAIRQFSASIYMAPSKNSKD